jgi:alpha-glucosidase
MTVRKARTWTILAAAALAFGVFAEEAPDGVFRLKLLPGECWWGGLTIEGRRQPFSDSEDYSVDMRVMHGRGDSGSNPAAPLLVSSRGRWVWCEQSFKIEQKGGTLAITPEKGAPVLSGSAGTTLRDAFRHCSKTFFPRQGTPDLDFFRSPIQNT